MRVAFRMKVHPGCEAEYIRRHNPIWPELKAALIERGVQSYSIFLDRATGDLFAFLETDNPEQVRRIADTDVCRKWWEYMSPLMPTNADRSPVVVDLEEVFRIDAAGT